MNWATGTVTTAAVTDPAAVGKHLWLGFIPKVGDNSGFGRIDEVNLTVTPPASFSGAWGDPDGTTFTGDMFTLLDGIAGSDTGAPSTVTISGLTPGETYLFQAYWLVKDNFGTRTMEVNLEGDTANISANAATNERKAIRSTGPLGRITSVAARLPAGLTQARPRRPRAAV